MIIQSNAKTRSLKNPDIYYLLHSFKNIPRIIEANNESLKRTLYYPQVKFDYAWEKFCKIWDENKALAKKYLAIRKCLKQLDKKDRWLLYAYFVKCMDYEKIYTRLNMSKRTMYRKVTKLSQEFLEMYNNYIRGK